MSNNLVHIGACLGCERRAVLDAGVCAPCLTPPRGRRWAELSHRARTDASFALACYRCIASEAGRRMFAAMYGVPVVLRVERNP